jgi:SAM-dependent MidA family methyltransferase
LSPESTLPQPDADARSHSERVVARIRAEIAAAGGWIPFSRYMELALYTLARLLLPGPPSKRRGDASPRRNDAVVRPGAFRWRPFSMRPMLAIFELGAGLLLAADLLNVLAARNALPSTYTILEPSPDLRERQRATIARVASQYLECVRWLDALPVAIDGAIIANEVLDSIPVHLIARRGGTWLERGVVALDRSRPAPMATHWRSVGRAAGACAAVGARGMRYPPQGDYLSELNPAAKRWSKPSAKIDWRCRALHRLRISGGRVLPSTTKHGHADVPLPSPQPRQPFVLPAYRHHRACRFSAIAAAGERAGLTVAGFAAQAPFLLGCGILDALAATGEPESIAYIKSAAAVQKLLSPAEMGELVKVMAMAKSSAIVWPGFTLADRSHRL